MKKIIQANKARGKLYLTFLVRMHAAKLKIKGVSKKEIVPFPIIFEKVCRNFSIPKAEAWDYLKMFEELGFIEIVKFKGIKLNFEVRNVKE